MVGNVVGFALGEGAEAAAKGGMNVITKSAAIAAVETFVKNAAGSAASTGVSKAVPPPKPVEQTQQ